MPLCARPIKIDFLLTILEKELAILECVSKVTHSKLHSVVYVVLLLKALKSAISNICYVIAVSFVIAIAGKDGFIASAN